MANSIVYFNQAASASNYSGGTLTYCCTAPAPPSGSGNITNDPVLADGYHLSASSPCVGSGGAAPSLADDIDGDAWASPPSIGCDEYQAVSAFGPMTITIRRDYLNARPGAPILFAASIQGHASGSIWDFGDGTILTNQPYLSHSWSSPGVYAAKLIAVNGTNPEGVTNSVEVQVTTAPVLYVAQQNLTPQPPFLSWSTAATNIQDAVDQAFSGGSTVLVSNGVYRTGGRANTGVLTNRVCLSRAVTVQSVNGSAVTLIEGVRLGSVPFGGDPPRFPGYSDGDAAVRCAYVCDGASLIGFTLTNGATRAGGNSSTPVEISGGGVFCESTNVIASDCVIVSNTCNWWGAGAYSGTLNRCQVSSNLNLNGSLGGGGGVAFSTVLNSTLRGNSGDGAGALSGILSNCFVSANSGPGNTIGSGVWKCQLYGCTVSSNSGGGLRGGSANDCIISGNSAGINLSGGGANATTLSNCVLYANRARDGGGAYNCVLDFCSVSNNYATNSGGGVYWNGASLRLSVPPPGNNNILAGNIAGGSGGGLYLASRSLALTNWTFWGNSAATNGGGIYAASSTWTLQDFTFTSNSAALAGGGVYAAGGSWTLQNCPFTGNSAGTDGGGLAAVVGATVSCYGSTLRSNTATRYGGAGYNGAYLNCSITGNSASDSGGGVYSASSLSTSTNCLVSGNLAVTNGGGVFGGTWASCKFIGNTGWANGGGANNASLTRSIVTNNSAKLGGGVYNTTLSQCLLTGNTADTGGGVYSGVNQAVNHSTVVGNFATNAGGGVYATGPFPGILSSILYFNSAPTSSNYSGGTRTFCCLLPGSTGTGNITNDPALIDWAGGNFRLQTNSPCINAGSGAPSGTVDLDGRPRVVGVKIDMGAYEFQGVGVGEFIYWLQQYGLPTGGSADSSDADLDQMNNWQEWIAGTNPTNFQSVLKLVSLTTSPLGAALSWQSVAGKNYWVERSGDPSSLSGFSLIQSNIPGLVGLTSFTDSEATNSVEYFYRVGVR